MNSASKCSNCAFVEYQDAQGPGGVAVIGEKAMLCKRMPPQIMAIPTQGPGGGVNMQITPMFPPVNAEMWCYEWEAENGAQDVTD